MDAPTDGHHATLARTIETDVIPRLMRAHRTESSRSPVPTVENRSSRRAVAHLKTILSMGDQEALHAYVDSMLSHGMAWDTLCLGLFAPVARHFGELWRSDDCSFSDVTLAVSMLQHLVWDRTNACGRPPCRSTPDRRILLAAVPGSQHMFGLVLVEDFFRRSGWTVSRSPGSAARDIVDAVRREWFPIVGLSLSRAEDAPGLPALIARLRAASRNSAIAVLVGGPYFNDRPDEALQLGADATAGDARQAVFRSERLIKGVSRH